MEKQNEMGQILWPGEDFVRKARLNSEEEYKRLYKQSIEEPNKFWAREAEDLVWFKKWDTVLDETKAPFFRWFVGGKINACYNCVDRWAKIYPQKPAIIWQGEPNEDVRVLTYAELKHQVNQFAYVLRNFGIKKGDRVALYLPMIPELPIAMLACARVGAIHTVVFGGLSAEALKMRIQDAEAKLLVTADGYWRAGKIKNSLGIAKEAVKECPSVVTVIVVKRTGEEVLPSFSECRKPVYCWWHEEMKFYYSLKSGYELEDMDAEDILFLLYTSGSTGKPKGVIHTTGGYLVYVHSTMKVFDIRDEDIFWCTADIGWITGHSYIVYGPLSCGATVFMYEGVPTYPQPDRYWELIEKFRVTVFYTAPTVIRSLIQQGTKWIRKHDLFSLRLLGSVGEPIDPKSWIWFHENIGKKRCPVVDTYWQTETGGIILTTLPGVHAMKPGAAGFPFFGVAPEIIEHREEDEENNEPDLNRPQCPVGEMGKLMITRPWPGMLKGLWRNPERYRRTYFEKFGEYLTGDGAVMDGDGYFWLKGRIDETIKVSGHLLSTAETESALISSGIVTEAAVVGRPHEIKGNEIFAFVVLKPELEPSEELKGQIVGYVRRKLGPIYSIETDCIQFVSELPKTKSGKIMRRILKKIAAGERDIEKLGDLSTLADPEILQKLIR